MTLPRPSAILFDWDNTLVDTWPVIHRALHDTFTHFNRTPWTLEEVKERVAKSMRDSFPVLFGDKWQEAGDIYVNQYRSYNISMLHPLPDTLIMLEKLKEAGIPIGVVSNKKSFTLNGEIDHLGWRHFFGGIVGSDDAEHDKPHRAPVDLALQKLGLPASSDIWFVGDSHVDLEVANNCDMIAILYGDEAKPEAPNLFKNAPFHQHILTHQDLLRLLKI